jgi:hypothetical protein
VNCQCGCGRPTSLARQGDTKRGYAKGQPVRFLPGHNQQRRREKGYYSIHVPAHPRASQSGEVYEHVIIAERALGRYLPDGVEIHHVDENPRNNTPGNLVICQSKAYHKLLHVRMRVLRAGGDPNTQRICSTCKRLRTFSEFNRRTSNVGTGLQSACRDCGRTRDTARRSARRMVAKIGVCLPQLHEAQA